MSQDVSAFFPGLARPVLIGIGILVAVQLCFQIWAIVDLIRRDSVRFNSKWIWLAVIIVGGFLGLILYAAFGRNPALAPDRDEERPTAARDQVDAGLSSLYRDRDRP